MRLIAQDPSAAGTEANRKAHGAYYTDGEVASFLVAWAVRSGKEVVLDPSFGGGVFLRAACRRIVILGGAPAGQVKGVEIDREAYSPTLATLHREFGTGKFDLRCSDFFELAPGSQPADAVVGNPPFIRYHRFNGGQRKLALQRAASEGVKLSELASSWAPFLVHAISMVRPGGRLAMVAPFEITHARYARPVLRFLAKSFAKVTFLTFRQRMFPHLSEDTLLLLAETKGAGPGQFTLRDHSSVADLFQPEALYTDGRGEHPVDESALCEGKERLIEYLLPAEVRELYEELRQSSDFRRLGDFANVGIGYVTGANDFFHLHPSEAQLWKIPPQFLKPAVRRGRVLKGVRFTEMDWQRGLETKETGYLLHIDRADNLPRGLLNYLELGEHSGISRKFKCRSRVPWYRVPNVYYPDAFLTYMNGTEPKLVANAANAAAPNTLHIVRLHKTCPFSSEEVAALWHNSLTRLSTEINGHALGGGMLKMEPQEARSLLLPVVRRNGLSALADELDEICRTRGYDAAEKAGNERILRAKLGLSARDCTLLQIGRKTLLTRRYRNGQPEPDPVSSR